MNPTTPPQPLELIPLTAYSWLSTTGKNWRLDWGPPGRRRLPRRSREGVSEAVVARQAKSDPRPIVPAHRGAKGRQADGTARTRVLRKRRPGESPPSLRDERDARYKRIPRPNTPHPSRGRRIAHEPGIASPGPIRQVRSYQRGHGTGPLSRAGILALQGGEDVNVVRRRPRRRPD